MAEVEPGEEPEVDRVGDVPPEEVDKLVKNRRHSPEWDPDIDRLIRYCLQWLNRRGCIVQRTPPAALSIVTGRIGHKREIRRRFSTRDSPQVWACMPGGRFLAVRVRGRRKLREGQDEWLRTCAALGGACLVVKTETDLRKGWQALIQQRPDPAGWIPAEDIEIEWPRVHTYGQTPGKRERAHQREKVDARKLERETD